MTQHGTCGLSPRLRPRRTLRSAMAGNRPAGTHVTGITITDMTL